MLIRQGTARDHATDRRLACILAAIAGAVNTAAFHAVGFFSANMTGNVSALSDHASRADWMIGVFYLAIIIVFIIGAAFSSLVINSGRRRQMPGIYAWVVMIEALLMAALGAAELALPGAQRGPMLVLGLAFLMGLQNAVVTQISDARVRTTHVSGMSTDIGIGLSMLFDIARRREPRTELAAHVTRLRLHTQTVLSFLAGGVAGVLAYQRIATNVLFVAAAILMLIATLGLHRSRRAR
ncbi:DUF1275 domain-containing protein [Dyella terrae]|uniref:DUF1275 domain-containing protein n=3 Tax=Dyella TaxID=231454 RepID=A0A4R0Z234_9GAMM|nr:YoaK family protein [Dyella soli]TBR40655.1 DUF1275 domain-containing protein [Dyella terrae]TCI13879.1 DUF1275 domain-containing protein [Dyella soli]